jgi:hypothetical protein
MCTADLARWIGKTITFLIVVFSFSFSSGAAMAQRLNCALEFAGVAPEPKGSIYAMNPEMDLEIIQKVREEFKYFAYGKSPAKEKSLRLKINAELRKDQFFAHLNPAEQKAFLDDLLKQAYVSLDFYLTKSKWLQEMESRGLSPTSMPPSFAGIARQHQISSLQHQTSIKNLLGILKSRAISASGRGESVFGGGLAREQAAYLSAKTNATQSEWLGELEAGMAVIEFKPEVLDSVEWSHATPRPGHGMEREDSVKRDASFEIFAIQAEHGLGGGNRKDSYNEIVSYADIPITPTTMKNIHVPAKDRDKILAAIRRAKLSPPPGMSWEEVVISH